MLFKTFAQKLYRSIGCETTQADFVFDILSSVLSDKYTEKDQIIAKPYSNGGRMLRYYFDGTKSIDNMARKIIRYIEADNFEWFYSNMFDDQPDLIRNVVNEFSDEIPEINDDNFAIKLGKLLVDILFDAAKKSIDIPENEYSKFRHNYTKKQMVSALLLDVNYKSLVIMRSKLLKSIRIFRTISITQLQYRHLPALLIFIKRAIGIQTN